MDPIKVNLIRYNLIIIDRIASDEEFKLKYAKSGIPSIAREKWLSLFLCFLEQNEFVETITELMSIIYLKTPMIYAVEHILTLEPAPIGHCAW